MESAGVEFRRLTWIKYLKFKIKVTFWCIIVFDRFVRHDLGNIFRLCLLLILIFLNLTVRVCHEHVGLTSPMAAKDQRALGFVK